MEEADLASFWSHHEVVDELKRQLLYTTIELESARMEANETLRKNRETVRDLIEHLNTACQERDEARGKLHKLLNKVDLIPASFSAAAAAELSNIETEPSPTPLPRQLNRANSSITDSTSLSHGGGGGGSSPADSFFDTVTSPDYSNVNLADNSNNTTANVNTSNNNLMFAAGPSRGPEYHAASDAGRNSIDQASQIIDGLSKGKPLPQKGRLLEAVMAAGPLLQTLFVAGPLPQWRNPPPTQPLKVVPPAPFKGCDVGGGGVLMNQKAMAQASTVRGVVNPSPTYLEMSCGGSNSLLNFTNIGHSSGACPSGMPLQTSASSSNGHIRGSKRPRFQ